MQLAGKGYWGILTVIVLAGLLQGSVRGVAPLTAEEIMRKTVAKADGTSNASPRLHYAYNKVSVTEKLDTKGEVAERREKLIRIQSGKGSVVQIKVNGKPLSQDQLRREQEEVQAEDARMNDSRVARRSDNWERLLTGDLIARYKFHLIGEESFNNRPAYLLAFEPKSVDLPVREISDRFINNLCGKVWIDAQDFEIAKADLWLQSDVALWGGILGTLRKFDYKVERVRLDDGVWVNRTARGEFIGRKLLEKVFLRTRVECRDFEKLLASQTRGNR